MNVGIAPVAFDVVGDWHVWLPLGAVLVLCWGLVVVATATLFGGHPGGRHIRRFATPHRGGIRSDKPPRDDSQEEPR
jgi:hypothetical protein